MIVVSRSCRPIGAGDYWDVPVPRAALRLPWAIASNPFGVICMSPRWGWGSGSRVVRPLSQGVALGWYVSPRWG